MPSGLGRQRRPNKALLCPCILRMWLSAADFCSSGRPRAAGSDDRRHNKALLCPFGIWRTCRCWLYAARNMCDRPHRMERGIIALYYAPPRPACVMRALKGQMAEPHSGGSVGKGHNRGLLCCPAVAAPQGCIRTAPYMAVHDGTGLQPDGGEPQSDGEGLQPIVGNLVRVGRDSSAAKTGEARAVHPCLPVCRLVLLACATSSPRTRCSSRRRSSRWWCSAAPPCSPSRPADLSSWER